MLKTIIVVLLVALILFALDRLFLAMERRGWIYYRYKKASPGSAASAFLEVEKILDPRKKHVVEIQHKVDQEDDENGGPK